jgi:hypothetical protein
MLGIAEILQPAADSPLCAICLESAVPPHTSPLIVKNSAERRVSVSPYQAKGRGKNAAAGSVVATYDAPHFTSYPLEREPGLFPFTPICKIETLGNDRIGSALVRDVPVN